MLMTAEKKKLDAGRLSVEHSENGEYVQLGSLRVRLANPYELPFQWVGHKDIVNQLKASWHCATDADRPMSPRIIGKPGMGKTVLAYAAGKALGLPVYFFQATSDTHPNDVLVTPVVVETGKDSSRVDYVASPLVTAMIVGGVCVFDEGNRMQEKAWASLAPLLDSRRSVDCVAIGVTIKAHKDFRFVATMNDDASCFELPDYIKSRLQPQITLNAPDRAEERRILEANLPNTVPAVLDYVADFLDLAHQADEPLSVRDGVNIATYAGKIIEFERDAGRSVDPGDAVVLSVEQILGVRQARYIKQIIWQERSDS